MAFHLKVAEDELQEEIVEASSGNPKVLKSHGKISLLTERTCSKPPASQLVCLLGLPYSFSVIDLLAFLQNALTDIKHIRVLTHDAQERYLALLRFSTCMAANEFVDVSHGSALPTISLEQPEPVRCFLVSSVEFVPSSDVQTTLLVDRNSDLVELPTCPCCLERIHINESITSTISIFCDHLYHVDCLYNLGDSKCAVCRYTINNKHLCCSQCALDGDIWSCLVCRFISSYFIYVDTWAAEGTLTDVLYNTSNQQVMLLA
ncbi:hypothetical protein GEMRC1_011880 [Eukaryota sp. GEM-RC1]